MHICLNVDAGGSGAVGGLGAAVRWDGTSSEISVLLSPQVYRNGDLTTTLTGVQVPNEVRRSLNFLGKR